jgi:uncharacterized protein (TIGR01777 family)
MHVAVSGSSGLIGTALVSALEGSGHRVTRLVRPASPAGRSGVEWDPSAGVIDARGLEGIDAAVNLAGRSIGERRWTTSEKDLLYRSRIDSTRLLAGSLAGLADPPRVLIGASAVGYYGDRGDEHLTEDSPPGEGFFADLCRDWEAAAAPAAEAGIRVVQLRTGIVLSRRGGALGRLLAPFGPSWLSPYRWGLGGWVGRGDQWWSWVTLSDQVRAILHLLESDVDGPVNLAVDSVTNRAFMKAVGRALRRPVLLPIPRWVFRLILGSGLAGATLFDGQRATADRLREDGFVFADTDLDAVLADLLGRE